MKRFAAFVVATLIAIPAHAQQEHWVATWATSLVSRPAPAAAAPGAPGGGAPAAGAPRAGGPPAGAPPGGGRGRGFAPPVSVTNQTLRQIAHTSIGGSRVRVVLSNVFGTAPIEIGAASIALRDSGASIKTPSLRVLTFGGKPSRAIAPGAVLISDPVDLNFAALSDLAIDLFVPGDLGVGPSPVTTHNGASQTNYVSATGNHVGEPAWTTPAATTNAWLLLARVEVTAPVNTLGVVAFGDSITDGAASTSDTNNRWPDELARRLVARKGPPLVAVVNAGISGNQVLGDGAGVSALARFDKDALMQSGVTHVVVLEGINDIGIARNNPAPSADDLIAGHRQLIDRAHARGLKICGATLTPFEGAPYYTPEGEAKRSALNEWIRTGKAYDCVIDFDKATRDPAAPTKFLPAYDSGDHLHPGDAGYKAMGAAVELTLFR